MKSNKIYLGCNNKAIKLIKSIKSRLKKLNRIDWLYVAFALIIIALFITIAIARLSAHKYSLAINDSRNNLQILQDKINNILPPDKIELGQQDLSIDYLLQQTNPETFSFEQIRTPSRIMLFISLFPPNASLPFAATSKAGQIHSQTNSLISYQYDVFYAIGSVLEYNPRADFGDKTLNDEQIRLRIDNARKGLAEASKAAARANVNTIKDPAKQDVVKEIESLQQKLEEFNESRNYEVWAKDVESAQIDILENRQAFWEEQTNIIFSDISDINQSLSELEEALK